MFVQICLWQSFPLTCGFVCLSFYLKAKGRSWLSCLGQLTETMNFVFIVKHLQCLSHPHLGLNFILLSLNAMEKASRGGEMTIPIILLLCLWNYSRLIKIFKVLRAWTYNIIIAYFPVRSVGAYRRHQISAFTLSKDDFEPTHQHMTREKKYLKTFNTDIVQIETFQWMHKCDHKI